MSCRPDLLPKKKNAEGSLEGRHECRTRTVKICEAALRHPWIHSPHCLEEGGLRSKCSKCGKKLPSPNVCFPIYFGSAPCSSCDSSTVTEERAKIVRDLGLLLPRNSGSAKHSAAPALWSGSKETEVCRRRSKAFDWSCPDCGWCVPEENPRAWLRSSMLGRMARCCRRRNHLFVMIFGHKGVKLLQIIRESS